jgi:hypothetical protein
VRALLPAAMKQQQQQSSSWRRMLRPSRRLRWLPTTSARQGRRPSRRPATGRRWRPLLLRWAGHLPWRWRGHRLQLLLVHAGRAFPHMLLLVVCLTATPLLQHTASLASATQQ